MWPMLRAWAGGLAVAKPKAMPALYNAIGWIGMRWDGMAWDGVGCDGMRCDAMGSDGMLVYGILMHM